jgi:hypothetical protein
MPSDTAIGDKPTDGQLDAPVTTSVPSNATATQETSINVEQSDPAENPPPSNATTSNATVDVDSFDVVLTYQGVPGVCSGSVSGIGCAGEAPPSTTGGTMGGNPNTLLNCFDVTTFVATAGQSAGIGAPNSGSMTGTGNTTVIQLKEVRFWIGESSDLPPDLSVRVWDSVDGTVESGPNRLLFEQDVLKYSVGENTVLLDTAAGDDTLIPPDGVVCVGVYSESIEHGLRIQTEASPDDADAIVGPSTGPGIDPVGSFLMTPSCGLIQFTPLRDLMVEGGLCIESIISVTTTTTGAISTGQSFS